MTTKGNKNNLDLIKELAKVIEEGNLSEIELEQNSKTFGSIYVRVSRNNYIDNSKQLQREVPEPEPKVKKEPDVETEESQLNTNLESHPGMLFSPMVGTVYLAPEPEAPPFVKIGDEVKAGQTILIVEAMKTLNQIPATKAGVIKRILVDDGTPVEFGSPLVIIE